MRKEIGVRSVESVVRKTNLDNGLKEKGGSSGRREFWGKGKFHEGNRKPRGDQQNPCGHSVERAERGGAARRLADGTFRKLWERSREKRGQWGKRKERRRFLLLAKEIHKKKRRLHCPEGKSLLKR